MASFIKEVDLRLAKRPLKTNGRLANLELTSLVKEATGICVATTSATMELSLSHEQILVFTGKWIQISVPSQFRRKIKFLVYIFFLKCFRHDHV